MLEVPIWLIWALFGWLHYHFMYIFILVKHKRLIEHEVEGFGIRLNKQPPNIYFKKKDKGGINFNTMVGCFVVFSCSIVIITHVNQHSAMQSSCVPDFHIRFWRFYCVVDFILPPSKRSNHQPIHSIESSFHSFKYWLTNPRIHSVLFIYAPRTWSDLFLGMTTALHKRELVAFFGLMERVFVE